METGEKAVLAMPGALVGDAPSARKKRTASAKKVVEAPPMPHTEAEPTVLANYSAGLKEVSSLFEVPAVDAARLRDIEVRAEQRFYGGNLVGGDQKMAGDDVADFLKISEESGLQRHAASYIASNMEEYPDYKTAIIQLDTQHFGLSKSIHEFNAATAEMVATKEARKAVEMKSMEADVGLGEPAPFLGVADGVSVNTIDGGFVVSFPFDRQLAAMMDRVLNASFNKDSKVYEVPAASGDALAKVVQMMRVESKAIAADLESIKELAWKSATKAQMAEGADPGVVPQVSTFREVGKVYHGDIVNANSRFVAQLTGFGKLDGAAFVTIHRMDDLDRPQIMKGESLAIVYNKRFASLVGEVSNFSKHKSMAEMDAEYQANLGKPVDGVTVTERGENIGVAFSLNPALYSRIKRLEGAAFNVADKVWEVPVAMKEFVLFAVEDMRNEFVVHASERVKMQGLAEEKMDGSKVWDAFTKDGQKYFGSVLAVGDRYALQNAGRGNFTLHHLSALNQMPIKGHNLEIQYKKGVGMVNDKDQQRGQDRSR